MSFFSSSACSGYYKKAGLRPDPYINMSLQDSLSQQPGWTSLSPRIYLPHEATLNVLMNTANATADLGSRWVASLNFGPCHDNMRGIFENSVDKNL